MKSLELVKSMVQSKERKGRVFPKQKVPYFWKNLLALRSRKVGVKRMEQVQKRNEDFMNV